MNEQELFSERMNGLLDLATDKGGILSKGEVHFYLKEMLQSEEQYEFVYQFLAEKGVRVEGWRGKQPVKAEHGSDPADTGASAGVEYENIEDFTGLVDTRDTADEAFSGSAAETEKTDFEGDEDDEDDENGAADVEDLPLPAGIDESLLTEDEKRYLKYYQADLEQVEPITDTERYSLLNALAAGDPSVMNRLAEGHLYLVMEEIPAYLHAGVPVSDLIQEASIGLLEGIQSYRGMNFEAHVRYAIREALDAVTEEQQASDSVAKHLLDSISRADEATRKLSEDLGRAPTKEELAEYLRMDVDEVETLLKHSIDALTVSVSDEAYGKTEDAED